MYLIIKLNELVSIFINAVENIKDKDQVLFIGFTDQSMLVLLKIVIIRKVCTVLNK